MIEGRASTTAQRVASYRLSFDRLDAPFGDATADRRLNESVADGLPFEPSTGMERYLRLRTRFFDRVVVNAIERGVSQVVSIGAGYDGRAWRYAHPSVHWFEVDHPDTSADKQCRLEELAIDTSAVTFLGWDLNDPGLDDALLEGGFDADGLAMFICEGVIVYLEPSVTERLLAEVRSLCTPGSRLALSLSVRSAATDTRSRFNAAVAAMGEPALGPAVTLEDASRLFDATNWEAADLQERVGRAGLTLLRPRWVKADPPTVAIVGRFMEDVMHRPDASRLSDHIARAYDRAPRKVKELDLGVYRLDFTEGPAWIARVGPAARSVADVEGDAALLRSLGDAGFPAERVAADSPVSDLDGRGVLVTEMIVGRRPTNSPALSRTLAALLADLHGVEGPGTDRPGGAWHHLVPDGDPSAELSRIRRLVEAAQGRLRADAPDGFDILSACLTEAPELDGVPTGLVHPDFVVANALSGPGGHPRFIDWSGAGRGPRVGALGCLLWGCAHKNLACVTAAAQVYASRVSLTATELDLLGHAVLRRPLILAGWNFATGRQRPDDVARWFDQQQRMCRRATTAAIDALSG